MTLMEIAERKHHAFVAAELIQQAIVLYDDAANLVRLNQETDALRKVLDGDMKMSRALGNINEVMA